jgi:hypothetical protein
MHMFASIQRGLDASENRGVLGACEERIWKFQEYLRSQCDLTPVETLEAHS